MEPTVMLDPYSNSVWVSDTFVEPESNLDPASDPLALDVKPKPEPGSVKLETGKPGTEPHIDPFDTTVNDTTHFEPTFDSTPENHEIDPVDITANNKLKMESAFDSTTENHETDPLDITANNKLKMESTFDSTPENHEIDPLDITANNKPKMESAFYSTTENHETDPLDITPNNKPKMESTFDSTAENHKIDPLDITLPRLESTFNSTETSRSLLNLTAFNSSAWQACSIEPSAMNIKTEPLSVMQDSLPQGILPDSVMETENQSSLIFNEAHQPAVARSNSTIKEVFDSESSPCRSDCFDSESRDDDSQDSIQHCSDASLAAKFHLKQCSVPLKRMSPPELTFTHTAAVVISDRSSFKSSVKEILSASDTSLASMNHLKQCYVPLRRVSLSKLLFTHTAAVIVSNHPSFQSSVKKPPSTSHSLKHPRKASISTSNKFPCKICSRAFSSPDKQCSHERRYRKYHLACTLCFKIFYTKIDLQNHHRFRHVKDYSCDICDKICCSLGALKDHKSIHSETPPTCPVCNKIFSSYQNLRQHSSQIHNKVTISCTVCGKSFAKRIFLVHIKTHDKKYICAVCGHAYADKYYLKRHLLKHLNIRVHKCEACGKSFGRKAHLDNHSQAVHSKSRDHKCNLCGKSYKTEGHLQDHMKTHTKQFICEICNRSFSLKARLRDHILQHLNIRDCKCDVCGKRFVSRIRLNLHKKVHLGKRYPCEECYKVFRQWATLKQHRLLHHKRPSDGPGYPCSCCSNVFSSNEELISHLKSKKLYCVSCDLICLDVPAMNAHFMAVHSIETNHSCKACGLSCKNLKKLAIHEKIHTKGRFQCSFCLIKFDRKPSLHIHVKRAHARTAKYSCGICSKTFETNKYLSKHRESHSNPIQCNICNQTFSSKWCLIRHTSRRHSKEPVPKHSCGICSRSFKSITYLNRHYRVHSKPFKCQEAKCTKTFSIKLALVTHQEVHMSEKNHKCNICNKSFGLNSNLLLHIKAHRQRSSIIHTCDDCGKDFNSRGGISQHMAQVHMRKAQFKRFNIKVN